jgi:hypothetical protein
VYLNTIRQRKYLEHVFPKLLQSILNLESKIGWTKFKIPQIEREIIYLLKYVAAQNLFTSCIFGQKKLFSHKVKTIIYVTNNF